MGLGLALYNNEKCKYITACILRYWIPNPGVPCSKPLGDFKVDSVFHPSEVNQISNKNFWENSGKVKSKLPPHSGSVALKQLNSIYKKVVQSFKVIFFVYYSFFLLLCVIYYIVCYFYYDVSLKGL